MIQKNLYIYPEGKLFSLKELENKLNFRYLPQITFESDTERADISERALPSAAETALGELYKELVTKAYIPEVSLRFADETIGYGLFAEENLPSASYVGEYTGVVRRNDLRRYSLNNYLYTYPVKDINDMTHVIDATNGNLTRFINHSFKPNLRPVHIFFDGFYHLIFLALHPIAKGTELCFDYGQSYWYIRSWPKDL